MRWRDCLFIDSENRRNSDKRTGGNAVEKKRGQTLFTRIHKNCTRLTDWKRRSPSQVRRLSACVIFNWEQNPKELRVHRPDGTRRECGSVATVAVEPLQTDTWYALRWRITEQGMDVFVNDKLVFTEHRNYDLSKKQPILVYSNGSVVDVKTFSVHPIAARSK